MEQIIGYAPNTFTHHRLGEHRHVHQRPCAAHVGEHRAGVGTMVLVALNIRHFTAESNSAIALMNQWSQAQCCRYILR